MRRGRGYYAHIGIDLSWQLAWQAGRVRRSRWLSHVRRVRARVADWWTEQDRSLRDRLVQLGGLLAAGTLVVAALLLTRERSSEFESLPEAYESLTSVGVGCAPPVLSTASEGSQRVLCSASDGSPAVLVLSGSSTEASQAVAEAHASSEDIVHYAQLAGQSPIAPRPVLLGANWTLVGDRAMLEQVAAEYGGTIYPYPETPSGS